MADLNLSPATLAAVTSAAYGAVILSDTARSFTVMYNKDAGTVSKEATGVARFDGLSLIQNAAVLLAVRNVKDTETRKALNTAIAFNHVADAAMVQFQRKHHGLDHTQADISTALTLGVGAYAAYAAWRDHKKQKEATEKLEQIVEATTKPLRFF